MSRFRALAGLLILLWIVEVVNFILSHSLNGFGLVPRRLDGLPGILVSPILHGSFAHLLSNTGGLIALGGLVAMRGERHFVTTTLAIAVFSGALVWLFGRSALHVGASGLVFGYFGLLLGRAWYRRTPETLLIGAVVIAVYGGIIWGISPLQRFVSWEGHLAGLIAGLVVARLRARRDEAIPR
ncbi:MAG: rhomboid family intramembrane serine protease [Gammaproteobacteria bacterium]|nr:rhomboid family intramembrane serine protease [Gammaproteobacteria bacterium]MDH3767569.1 rhomboid family intramembrane serine protease [Gammaproteobacteria bacterium]